jgi:hypothetical protein
MALDANTLLRCQYCDYPVMQSELHKSGGCPRCFARKVKIAFSVTDQEREDLLARGYDFAGWDTQPNVVNG